MVLLSNPPTFLPNFKKGQDLVDFFLFFLVLLTALYFVYLFLFSTLELKIQYTSLYKALSLVLQTSEDIFLYLSIHNNNFVKVGFLDESKITYQPENHQTIKEIYYSFEKPTINQGTKNQLCLKRFMFSNSTSAPQVFWVCYNWS